tara:strand:+ start:95 stop:1069 length:975 start_codon:yes stop_codon:yes gene_type:complete
MSRGPILLIDAYNIFARSYIVNPSLNVNGEPVGGATGFVKSLGVLSDKFRPSKIIVCWEGGGSRRRRDMLPTYKSGRKPLRLNRSELYKKDLDSPENFMWQVALSIRLLEDLPIMQMYVDDCEADDVIGWLARHKFKDEDREIVICSADQDMLQLLRPGVKQYTPTGKKIIEYPDVLQKYGVSCTNFVTARAFIGDSSDRINGIKGVGFKTITRKFPQLSEDEFCSVDDILKDCQLKNSQKKMKVYESILASPEVPKLNWRLMYLDISNLSAEHVKQLNYRYDNALTGKNKLGFIRTMIAEGLNIPKHINPDLVWLRLSSIEKE